MLWCTLAFPGPAPPLIATALLLLLSVASILLAWIDLRRGIIPDWLNLAIGSLGLIWVLLDGWQVALAAGIQGIVVGAVVWLLRQIYFMVRKFHGLGLGDVKLLAVSAIWIGVDGIPVQLLVGSLAALATAGALQLAGERLTRQSSLPFGPFLALGLLASLALQQGGWAV